MPPNKERMLQAQLGVPILSSTRSKKRKYPKCQKVWRLIYTSLACLSSPTIQRSESNQQWRVFLKENLACRNWDGIYPTSLP